MPPAPIPLTEAAKKLKQPVHWLLEVAADDLSSVQLWTLATHWPCTWFGTFQSQGMLVRSKAVDDQGALHPAADVDFPDAVDRWVALDNSAVTQLQRDGVATVGRVWQRGYEAVLEPPVRLALDQVFVQSVDLVPLLPEKPLSAGGRRRLLQTIGLLTLALVHEREQRIKIDGARHFPLEEFGTLEEPQISALERHLMRMVTDQEGVAYGFKKSTLERRFSQAFAALEGIDRIRSLLRQSE